MLKKHEVLGYVLGTLALTMFSNLLKAQQVEPPQITGVNPSSTLTTPGAKVMVTGAHFSSDSIVYFGGLQARETTFINASALQAVTPYLRPGTYKLDLKNSDTITHSEVNFTALSAPVDSSIDSAETLAANNDANAAIAVFTSIATTSPDYDVRAYAHYRAGQLYVTEGNYMEAGVESALIWDPKVSMGVQTSWRYRLLSAEMDYSISRSNDQDTDLRIVDAAIKMDPTANPDLRFWRALTSARFGKIAKAKEDLKFILTAEPDKPSYLALAAYIGILTGDRTQLESFHGQQVDDASALALLGQATYLIGDHDAALAWWAAEAKISVSEAKLDCGAGRKHLDYGQIRVATALLSECSAVSPDSKEGKEAMRLLTEISSHPDHH